MVAYFISFLLLGLPLCWAEWTMGRQGGRLGFNSFPSILAIISRHPFGKYLGACGILIPIVVYMYYVYVEAWCLGYAVNFLFGNFDFQDIGESSAFWGHFIGLGENGSAFRFGVGAVGSYLLIVFLLNFYLVYQGISKGIEKFCTYAMPALILVGFVVLIRVITLGAPDADNPQNSVVNGLGFMWNPNKTLLVTYAEDGTENAREELVGKTYIEQRSQQLEPNQALVSLSLLSQLASARLWLSAAGQIFFSLSIGFGVILTYASYLKPKDDIVLSALSAASTNEFCEVAIGGLITITPAYVFLGAAGLAGAGLGTFDLGFKVLPMVFSAMPLGNLFGFLFFFLLFLAAITSSISMLQPGIAFIEESWNLPRNQSVAILGLVTATGTAKVVYFSESIKVFSTMDFWMGTFLIYVLATIQIILFAWVFGVDKGFAAAHQGSVIQIPRIYRFILRYVSPIFLLLIFFGWLLLDVIGIGQGQLDPHITDLLGTAGQPIDPVAWITIGFIAALLTAILLSVHFSPTYGRLKKYYTQSNS